MNSKIDSAVDIDEFRFGKVSVGNIVFPNGEERHKYNPKEDITPHEVSRLVLLFYFATTNKDFYTFDFYGYIQEHKLERHFDLV